MEIIKSKIIEAMTAHVDEIGIRVEEMLPWLHVSCPLQSTYHQGTGGIDRERTKQVDQGFQNLIDAYI